MAKEPWGVLCSDPRCKELQGRNNLVNTKERVGTSKFKLVVYYLRFPIG